MSQKFAERHAHGGNRPGLDDQEQSPSIEKAPERAQRFTQVNVLSAGAGHHGGKLAVRERANNRHKASDQPRANQQRGRVDLAANLRRHNKDAGANH